MGLNIMISHVDSYSTTIDACNGVASFYSYMLLLCIYGNAIPFVFEYSILMIKMDI